MLIELWKRGTELVPILQGTRIRVLDIGIEFEYQGMSPDEIVRAHPHLSLAQVHAALSYFYEHLAEMREKIRQDEAYVEQLRKKYPGKMALKMGPIAQ